MVYPNVPVPTPTADDMSRILEADLDYVMHVRRSVRAGRDDLLDEFWAVADHAWPAALRLAAYYRQLHLDGTADANRVETELRECKALNDALAGEAHALRLENAAFRERWRETVNEELEKAYAVGRDAGAGEEMAAWLAAAVEERRGRAGPEPGVAVWYCRLTEEWFDDPAEAEEAALHAVARHRDRGPRPAVVAGWQAFLADPQRLTVLPLAFAAAGDVTAAAVAGVVRESGIDGLARALKLSPEVAQRVYDKDMIALDELLEDLGGAFPAADLRPKEDNP